MGCAWLVALVLWACPGVSGTVGGTTLDGGQLAEHRHSGVLQTRAGAGNGWGYQNGTVAIPGGMGAVGSSLPHIHSLAVSTGTANNLPPYYALAFVMRL